MWISQAAKRQATISLVRLSPFKTSFSPASPNVRQRRRLALLWYERGIGTVQVRCHVLCLVACLMVLKLEIRTLRIPRRAALSEHVSNDSRLFVRKRLRSIAAAGGVLDIAAYREYGAINASPRDTCLGAVDLRCVPAGVVLYVRSSPTRLAALGDTHEVARVEITNDDGTCKTRVSINTFRRGKSERFSAWSRARSLSGKATRLEPSSLSAINGKEPWNDAKARAKMVFEFLCDGRYLEGASVAVEAVRRAGR